MNYENITVWRAKFDIDTISVKSGDIILKINENIATKLPHFFEEFSDKKLSYFLQNNKDITQYADKLETKYNDYEYCLIHDNRPGNYWQLYHKDNSQSKTIKLSIEAMLKTINTNQTNTKPMNSFSSTLKALLRTEPEKTFIKAGFMDSNEEITEKGQQALQHILWEQNKEAIKELADKIIESEK